MFNALQHINTKSTMPLKTLFDFSGIAQKDTLVNPAPMYHYNVQTDDKLCPSEWSYQRLQGRRIPTSSRERTLSSRILPLRIRVRRKTKGEMAALLVVQRNTGQTSAQTSTRSQYMTPSLSMSL